jgi:hypothetical protein
MKIEKNKTVKRWEENAELIDRKKERKGQIVKWLN